MSDQLSRELLAQAQVVSVAVLNEDSREQVLAPSIPIAGPLIKIDLREPRGLTAIPDALSHLFAPPGRFLQILLKPEMTPDAGMEVIVPEAALRDGLVNFSRTILLASLSIAVVVGALIYFAVYRLVVRPMQGLTAAVVRFSEEPEGAEISFPAGRSDEMQRASLALQTMQTTVSAAFRQRKRLAELGEAVAKINHDLRNSLAAAQIVSESLGQSEDPRVKRAVPRLQRAIERATALAEATLSYGRAKPTAPRLGQINVIPAIEEAAAEGLSGAPEIEWKLEGPGQLSAVADPEHVHRIVANLVRNAARAIQERNDGAESGGQPGRITACASRQGDWTVVEIADNGPGVPERVRARLFQPFGVSGAAGGAGLGLAIARELARGMKGELELSKTGDTGAIFTLRIPAG